MIDSWEKIQNDNFLNAEAIGPVGAERIVTIKDIEYADVFNTKTNSTDKKVCLFFEECKPHVLNKVNTKTLRKMFDPYGTDPKKCVGQQVTLYVAPVKVGRNDTTGIRIKEAPKEKCEDCGQLIRATRSKTVAELIEISVRNTGRRLCLDCMKKAAEQKKEETHE